MEDPERLETVEEDGSFKKLAKGIKKIFDRKAKKPIADDNVGKAAVEWLEKISKDMVTEKDKIEALFQIHKQIIKGTIGPAFFPDIADGCASEVVKHSSDRDSRYNFVGVSLCIISNMAERDKEFVPVVAGKFKRLMFLNNNCMDYARLEIFEKIADHFMYFLKKNPEAYNPENIKDLKDGLGNFKLSTYLPFCTTEEVEEVHNRFFKKINKIGEKYIEKQFSPKPKI